MTSTRLDNCSLRVPGDEADPTAVRRTPLDHFEGR